jgi:hypothetical protein
VQGDAPIGPDPGAEQRRRQEAAAEVNRRRVNEAIERGENGDGAVFVCECGYLGCNTTVELSIDAYEAVRSDFDRFLVTPGHEIDEVDRVVERHSNHLVVVKRPGEPREMAAATDERQP